MATVGTVVLICLGFWGLFEVAGDRWGAGLWSVISCGDDFAAVGRAVCDCDGAMACTVLAGVLVKDVMDGCSLDGLLSQAGVLLAILVGATWARAPTGCCG